MTYRDFATAALAPICALWLGSAITTQMNAHADARIIEEHGHLTDW